MRLKNTPSFLFLLPLIILFTSCLENKKPIKYHTLGSVKIFDPEAGKIVSASTHIEVLDSGFVWTEGPLWLDSQEMLLFSDVPKNKIYKWVEGKGTEEYLSPSGYTGSVRRGGEPGSNGLLLNESGKLVLCQHGDRRIALMDAPISVPKIKFETLAGEYKGKKLNSPNDIIMDSKGVIYFTDPPYGLVEPSAKELDFCGVYRLNTDGEISLVIDSIQYPNGLALTPDEKHLLVANSFMKKGVLYELTLDDKGKASAAKIVYDFTPQIKNNGDIPDGLKIDRQGNIYVTGPGGLWILNKYYKPLALLEIPHAVSNCYLANHDQTLYITGSDKILRVQLRK